MFSSRVSMGTFYDRTFDQDSFAETNFRATKGRLLHSPSLLVEHDPAGHPRLPGPAQFCAAIPPRSERITRAPVLRMTVVGRGKLPLHDLLMSSSSPHHHLIMTPFLFHPEDPFGSDRGGGLGAVWGRHVRYV